MIEIEGAAGGYTNCREEGVRTAIIPCRYTPPILEFSEEVLDFVSSFIERLVIGDENLSVPSRWNAGSYPAFH